MPDSSEASIVIGTTLTALAGAISRTLGGVMSFATITVRRDEMARPSLSIAWAWTLCRPFRVPTVFQTTVQRRALHVFVFAPLIEITTRAMLSPRAEPTISTMPAAGDGTATLTDTLDRANANVALKSVALRTEPTNAETAQCLLRKAVSSQRGGPRSCLTSKPSFGSSAIRLCVYLTRGFAPPPHDGFALLGKVSAGGGQWQSRCHSRVRRTRMGLTSFRFSYLRSATSSLRTLTNQCELPHSAAMARTHVN
jgi:hypothetical protein